jgi:hypothetical protein
MKEDTRVPTVHEIMIEFARSTGLSPATKVARRYLWTDAFAVCNFLELYQQTHDEEYKNLAVLLVDQVHDILGRHREDDARTGWISDLDEEKGRLHPTKGGLRIGKAMNERRPDEPFEDDLEWDRDGQYYHYLTKWMHALNRAARVTGDSSYHRWAIELAKTAHAQFTYLPFPGSRKRMYWKMSIDLSRALVLSMGHHDPLDGFITYNELQATVANDSRGSPDLDLSEEITDMATICRGQNWATEDPLGIGGLLCDAYRAAQMIVSGPFEPAGLLETLLDASRLGLNSYLRTNSLKLPAEYRLAFRELGLAIGLRAVARLGEFMAKESGSFKGQPHLSELVVMLMRYEPLIELIENFWLERTNTQAATWTEHRDINMVMLATSLAPDAYLTI